MIYLDNASTTKIHPDVFNAMVPWAITNFGNASSNHHFGRMAKEALDKARKEIADVVGCLPEEIIFTSGGTESDNLALFSRNGILISPIEHKAILKTAISPVFSDVHKNGVIDIESIEKKICKETPMVSVMAVNNETGVMQPYEDVANISHKHGKIFHTDAVQAFGHRPINITNIDLMSVSGHKINGPKGIGFLYASKYVQQYYMWPRMYGGGQEFGLRAGTEPVPLIVGLAEAVKLHANPKQINLGWFEDMLINECGAIINGVSCHDDPWKNIINFQLDIHNDTMIQNLSKRKIYLSAGSACNSSEAIPSHVLKAMGLSDDECNRSLRISVGEGISMDEAKTVVNEINRIRKEQKIVDSIDGM